MSLREGVVAKSYFIKRQCDPKTGRLSMVAKPDNYREWIDPMQKVREKEAAVLGKAVLGKAAAGYSGVDGSIGVPGGRGRPMSAPVFSSACIHLKGQGGGSSGSGSGGAGGATGAFVAQRASSTMQPGGRLCLDLGDDDDPGDISAIVITLLSLSNPSDLNHCVLLPSDLNHCVLLLLL